MRCRTTRVVAAALAPLAAGCWGENLEVPVTLSLDVSSCTVDTPDVVELTCPTAVGLALRADASGERLGSACVDLPGTDRTLETLPPLLDSVDLSTSADEPVRLEIGLFAPRAASDGCPDVSASDPDMLLYGDTEPTDLSSSVRGLVVTMVCVEVVSIEQCYLPCDNGYNSCAETGWCQQAYDACAAACSEGDAECMSMCQTGFESCMVDECSAQSQECMAGCSGQAGCDARCTNEQNNCLQYGACDARYCTCLDDCDAGSPDTCATAY